MNTNDVWMKAREKKHTLNVYISGLWLEEMSPTVKLKIKKPITDL